jgi:Uma2 family endonuclease
MDGGTALVQPHRFTVTDYDRMAEAGIFDEDSRVELIRGQIVDMVPIGAPHGGMVNRLTRLLVMAVSGRGVISVQNSVRLDDWSEPQPDFMVLKPRDDDYTTAIPTAADVMLIIEVADSSLDSDRRVKAGLYAENGIPEYWIVNLAERVVEVHRQPEDGKYPEIRRVGSGGMVEIASLPGVSFAVAALMR